MSRPTVTAAPGVRFGRPAMCGISVDAITETAWTGSVDQACTDFGLSRGEVLVACWWAGRYGAPRWRRRWAGWAGDAEVLLARGDVDYGAVPDPPWVDR